jgi:hypothetical protein
MATALRTLAQQPRPSERVVPGLLDGRESVVRLTRNRVALGRNRPPRAAQMS